MSSYIYFNLKFPTDKLLRSKDFHNKTDTYPSDTTTYLKVEKSALCCGLNLSYHQAVYKNYNFSSLITNIQLNLNINYCSCTTLSF